MQLPLVLALCVCDDVWVDQNTRKQSVLGIYGSIAADSFPHSVPHLAVYTSLTECFGKIKLRVRLVDVDEELPPVFDGQQEMDSPDPRATIQGAVRARNVVFPHPGEYRVQLYTNDELLLERRLIVFKIGVSHADH